MANDLTGQTIALAAMFQFTSQVDQLAKTGHLNSDEFKVAVNSLFCQSPSDPLEVYGQLKNLQTGLECLIDIYKKRKSRDGNDCIRYVMGIMHLQKRLAKHSSMVSVIASRLEKAKMQAKHFSITHENVIAGLAEIYTDTISTFSFRIQVIGEYQFLQQSRVADQIRVLLFAGVRAAVLWRQQGGSRLKVIMKHKQIAQKAEQLLEEAKREFLH